MTPFALWVLLIAVSQPGSKPQIDATLQPDKATCERLATSYADAEDTLNAANTPAFADTYQAACILVVSTPTDAA